MTDRHFPVRPDLGQLQREAAELFRAKGHATLEAAQLALAESYGLPDWPRLELACTMIDAIQTDDSDRVRELVEAHPNALHEDARGVDGNWGPPMSYAANLGRNQIIATLHDLGARDHQYAFDRACLQGQLETARQLHAMGACPEPDAVMGPAETQSGAGMEFLLQLGAGIHDDKGDPLAPVAMVLETYCRDPLGKHRCLELFAEHGIDLPDTPPMAVHRGRIDLLEDHLRRDSDLLSRTFSHPDIYPPTLGCHADESLALHGTPLAGATLLHLCVDNDEIEIAEWLLDRGADPDTTAAIDDAGFGGHTALFCCVVSQPYRVGRRKDDAFARLLLDHGADTDATASLRKRLRFVVDETMHEYRDVTPLGWGEQFHDPDWVSEPVMRLLRSR
jgi:Ankyrin repeat